MGLTRYVLFIFFGLICGCKQSNDSTRAVRQRLAIFPKALNPVVSQSPQASLLQKNFMGGLIFFDHDGSLKPLLVKDLPVAKVEGSETRLEYTIRKEAKWPDGSDITNNDIAFSLKLYKLPLQQNLRMRLYLSDLIRLDKDSLNNKRFSIVGEGNAFDLTVASGDFDILQRSVYDPNGILDNFTFNQLGNDTVLEDEKLKAFLLQFLQDPLTFNGQYFSGIGPYSVSKIEDGNYIVLTKKERWWGSSLLSENSYFEVYPAQLIYTVIPETLIALHSLHSRELDAMFDIPSQDFIRLSKDKTFTDNFYMFAPLKYKFTYLGLNSRHELLSKKEIRLALAHLLDISKIVDVVEGGYAETTIGPINPANEYYYNSSVENYEYNPEESKLLIEKVGYVRNIDGWYSDANGELLELEIIHRPSPIYESICLILKEEAEKIGVKINIQVLEGRIVSKRTRSHSYELTIGIFSGSPYSMNFSGLFGTQAAAVNGMNFTNFGDSRSDSLIQMANQASDSVLKRKALHELQEMLHNEATMIFLYFSQNKIAISKRFEESRLNISTIKPGYDVTSFKLK